MGVERRNLPKIVRGKRETAAEPVVGVPAPKAVATAPKTPKPRAKKG